MRFLTKFGFLAGALWLAAAAPALADMAGAEQCATTLPPLAHRIYAAVRPGLKPGDNLSTAIRAQVAPWVWEAQVSRGDARPAAMAASFCLRQAQH